jgi:hypothetical protein
VKVRRMFQNQLKQNIRKTPISTNELGNLWYTCDSSCAWGISSRVWVKAGLGINARSHSENSWSKMGWGMAQVAECLPSKYKSWFQPLVPKKKEEK